MNLDLKFRIGIFAVEASAFSAKSTLERDL